MSVATSARLRSTHAVAFIALHATCKPAYAARKHHMHRWRSELTVESPHSMHSMFYAPATYALAQSTHVLHVLCQHVFLVGGMMDCDGEKAAVLQKNFDEIRDAFKTKE
jgi:hypothetical protein